MLDVIRKGALAGTLALTALQLLPTAANAQYYGDGYGFIEPQPREDYGRQRYWDRPSPPQYDYYRGGCSRRDVVDAARDEGFRRIDRIEMTPRRIIVEGWNDGGPDRMAFANRPGCPTIGGY